MLNAGTFHIDELTVFVGQCVRVDHWPPTNKKHGKTRTLHAMINLAHRAWLESHAPYMK